MKRFITAGAIIVLGVLGSGVPAGATSTTRLVSHITAIGSDMHDVSTSAYARDYAGLSFACSTLSDDSIVLLSDSRPRTVNKTSWRHIRTAANLYERGAAHCVTGADNFDAAEIATASGYMTQGTAEVNLATKSLGL